MPVPAGRVAGVAPGSRTRRQVACIRATSWPSGTTSVPVTVNRAPARRASEHGLVAGRDAVAAAHPLAEDVDILGVVGEQGGERLASLVLNAGP